MHGIHCLECVCDLVAGQVKCCVIISIHQAQVWIRFVQQEL